MNTTTDNKEVREEVEERNLRHTAVSSSEHLIKTVWKLRTDKKVLSPVEGAEERMGMGFLE